MKLFKLMVVKVNWTVYLRKIQLEVICAICWPKMNPSMNVDSIIALILEMRKWKLLIELLVFLAKMSIKIVISKNRLIKS